MFSIHFKTRDSRRQQPIKPVLLKLVRIAILTHDILLATNNFRWQEKYTRNFSRRGYTGMVSA